jgi:WD40 repeat protein
MAIPVEGVVAIAPAPDGRLSLFTANGQTGLLDPRTGEIAEGLPTPSRVEELVFSPDGQAFALRTGSEIRVWDMSGARTRFTLPIQEEVRRIAFSPQGSLLLVGGERTLSGYYVETGRRAFAFDLYGPADQFIMTPDERLIFQMTDRASDLEVWDAYTGEWWGSLEFEPLTAIALSPDGRLLTAAENEMRPIEDEGYEGPFPTRVALWRVSIDPDRREVRLDLQEELGLQPEMEGKFPLPLKALQFTPDGRRIVGLADWVGEGNMNGRLYVWDAASGRMIGRAVLPPRPLRMALMEEGRSVAVLIGYMTGVEVRIYEIPGR